MSFRAIATSPYTKWTVLVLALVPVAWPAAKLLDPSGGDDQAGAYEDGGFFITVSVDQLLFGRSQASPYVTPETVLGRFDTLDLPDLTRRGPPTR